MSSSARMWSTARFSTALDGVPEKRACAGSCTTVTPPAPAMAKESSGSLIPVAGKDHADDAGAKGERGRPKERVGRGTGVVLFWSAAQVHVLRAEKEAT